MASIGSARQVVLVSECRGEVYGNVLDEATRAYASGFAAHGYSTRILDSNAAEFVGEVERLARDPQVAAFFSAGGKGLHLQSGEGDVTRPFLEVDKPVICQHGDHPYQGWIAPIVRADFPAKFLFFNDPASVAYVRRQGLAQDRVFTSPPCIFGADDPAPAGPRDIPILFVGIVVDAEAARSLLRDEYPDLMEEFAIITRRGLDDLDSPAFDITQQVLNERGRDLDLLSRKGQTLLHRCDWWVRQERRRRFLFSVRRHPVLVVAQKGGSWSGMHPDTRFMPMLPLREVLRLCSRARVMLLPQPTYPNGLTERILYTMDRGAAVVTTRSPAMEHYFVPGRDLLLTSANHRDVERQLDVALYEGFRAPMAESAQAIVRRQFTPEHIVAGYLARIRAAGWDI